MIVSMQNSCEPALRSRTSQENTCKSGFKSKSGSQWGENFRSVFRDKEQAEKMLATTGSKLVLN
jgi:hypothetical protein